MLKALTTMPTFLQIVYNIDAVKTNVPEALEILADSVLNPAFLNWEVRDALARLKEDLKEIEGNPQTMLLEVGVSRAMLRRGETPLRTFRLYPWPCWRWACCNHLSWVPIAMLMEGSVSAASPWEV